MKKISVFIYLFIQFISVISFAQGYTDINPTEKMVKIQQEFNRNLISEMSSDLMNNPIVGWNSGGLVKTIFSICFLIALAQALSNSNPSGMLTELAKLAFYSWLITAMLGGPTYQRFSFLKTPYDNYTSNSSLDVDIFNFFAYHADTVADSLFKAAGPQKLMQASRQNKIMTENFINARRYCSPNDGACVQKYMKKTKVDPNEASGKVEKDGSGMIAALNFLAELALQAYKIISDLTLALFFLLSWAVDIVRSAINMFIMISFGIITGVSFFLMKFIFPFALIPKYRSQVMRAVKVPLSATLYGLATSIIVYVSAVGFTAMNTAATNTIINKLAEGNVMDLLAMIQPIQLSMITGMLVFSLLQIFAITKIPKLCRDLLDLSFDSFVNFAQEAVTAGVSIAGQLGAAAITGGASVLGSAGGGLAAKGLGSVSGTLAGAVGSRFGILPSKNLVGSNFSKGDGSSSGSQSNVSKTSVSGMELASSSAMAPTSTTEVAKTLTTENLSSPVIKEPNKNANLVKNEEETKTKKQTIVQGLSPNASPEARQKALDQILGKRENKTSKLGNLFSAALNAGTGNTSELDSMISGGVSSTVGSTQNFIEDFTESKASKEEKKEKIREAKIEVGLDPDDPNDPDNMSFAQRIKSKVSNNSFYKNVKDSHNKSKDFVTKVFTGASAMHENNSVSSDSTQRDQVIRSTINSSTQKNNLTLNEKTIEKINSTEELTAAQREELIKYKTSFNLDEKSSEVVENKLNQEISKSIDNISKGSGTEDDFSLAYRSQNLSFKDPTQKINAEELSKTNEEFKKYTELKNDQYQKAIDDLKNNTLDSKEGSDALEKASKLVESGYVSDSEYKKIVASKSEEYYKTQEEQQRIIEARESEILSKQKEKQEQILRKLKTGDQELSFEFENQKYEFGLNKNKVSDEVFLKNGEVSGKFSEIESGFINSLSQQAESINKQLTAYNNSSNDFKTVSYERYRQLRNNLSIIEQIIDIYKNKNNK